MELGEHEPNEPPVADCDCRRCAVATRDALRKDAERYRWLRKQGNREKAADMTLHRMNLDAAIDAEMAGANTRIEPARSR